MGNSYLNHVTCFGGMQLIYNEIHVDREHHSISMNNCAVGTLYIDMLQISYKVTLMIINIQVQHNTTVYNSFIQAEEIGTNEVLIINCHFVSNIKYRNPFFIYK